MHKEAEPPLPRQAMGYTVHSDEDRRRMLENVGVSTIDDLFTPIPEVLRRGELDLPGGSTEQDARARGEALAAQDRLPGPDSFLGGGCYRHFVPAAVRSLVSRSEFATAYTPYQPEISQGTLEHTFEFQTCMCELTGLDVANASLYDGATALAEGAFMALRLTGREQMAVSEGVHPMARRVVDTYASGPALACRRLPLDLHHGTTAIGPDRPISPVCGAILAQQPNYLGVVEDLEALAAAAHAAGALLVVAVDPGTLGVLEAPGVLGADIVVGDVQVFGNPASFGGPSAGFLACRTAHVRQIPGRLVGQTVDEDGRRCYTLTLQAREQHIRRAKATSNICSNQALSALAATIHLALLGPRGLRERGEICLQRAHHLHRLLCAIDGVSPLVEGPFFNEFALRLPCDAGEFVRAMRTHGIDAGVPLNRLVPVTSAGDAGPGQDGPATGDAGGGVRLPPGVGPIERTLLVAVTELNPPEALARYVAAAELGLATSGAEGATP
jgi:glycine dehydrogenase subunit 1